MEGDIDVELLALLATANRKGGVRKNSGRPKTPPDQKLWRLSIGLTQPNRRRLEQLANANTVSMSHMINLLIEQAYAVAELDK